MASLKKAIEQKCKDCTYDSKAPGTWREQVEFCTVRACALWPVRPVTMATVAINRRTKESTIDLDAILDGLEDDEEELANA